MILTSRTNSFQVVKELASTGALQSLRLGLNLRLENFTPILEIDYVYRIETGLIFKSNLDIHTIKEILK